MGFYSDFSRYYYNYYYNFFFFFKQLKYFFLLLAVFVSSAFPSKFVFHSSPLLPGTMEKFFPLHWLLMLLVKWAERKKKISVAFFFFFLLPFSRSNVVVWTGSSSTDRDRWFIIMLLPRHKPLGESSDRKSRVNFMCCRQREIVFFWGKLRLFRVFLAT